MQKSQFFVFSHFSVTAAHTNTAFTLYPLLTPPIVPEEQGQVNRS